MQAIASLAEDDPYLKLPRAARLALRRERKNRFNNPPIDQEQLCEQIRAIEPDFSPGEWRRRQEQIYRKHWFAIEGEIDPPPPSIKIHEIQLAVRNAYGLTKIELIAERRTAPLVRARQIGMYLAKTMTGKSLPEIGRRFGNRDHTTVLHAVRKIAALVKVDSVLAAEIESIKADIVA